MEHVELQDYTELGAGQSPGERVRGHWLQSKHPDAFSLLENSVPCHAALIRSCLLQVLYKKNRHSRPSVMETNTTSVELALPTDEDYIIQIKPFGEGGEGSSSRQITIPRIPGQWRAS